MLALTTGAVTSYAQLGAGDCADQQPASKKLQLEASIDPLLVSIDKSSNGTVTLLLENRQPQPLTIPPGALTVTDFCHADSDSAKPGYRLNSQAIITGVPSAPIAQGEDFPVKIVFSQVWEVGESRAQLKLGPDVICNFLAIKEPAPFAVQIDGSNPEAVFGPGEAPSLILSNADRATYFFKWSLIAPERARSQEFTAQIAPNGKLDLDLGPAQFKPGISTNFILSAGTLRDEVLNGYLQLQPATAPGMSPQPPRQLPLKMRFRLLASPWQQLFNIVLTALLILLGMYASLFFRYFIPNAAAVAKLNRQLNNMETRLRGIDENLPTQPRTVLEATVDSCRHRLKAVIRMSPAASTPLAEVQSAADMCSRWIDCAYSAADILAGSRCRLQTGFPPTLMRITEQKCDRVLHPFLSGFTTPEELQAMNDALKDAGMYLDAACNDKPIPDLEAIFKNRLELFKDKTLAELRKAYPQYCGLFDELKNFTIPAKPAQYRDFDVVTLKVTLLVRLQELMIRVGGNPCSPPGSSAGSTPASPALQRMTAHRDRFLSYLNTESYESLEVARVLIMEMAQDFYSETLVEEVVKEPPSIGIVAVPTPVEPSVPVHYSLRFTREALNHVAATQEWSLVWRFLEQGHQTASGPVARTPETQFGWDVYHRFQSPGDHTVSVDIFDIGGQPIRASKPISRSVRIEDDKPQPHRFKRFLPTAWTSETQIENLRTFFLLALALVGVFATARAQVEKLNVLEGAAALVAIGFAADIVKSAVSDKPTGKT
ncbi:MAG: hypothetical protein JO340_18650 [Acidobacteriaceae bacterium]|nr:hypothetical protein [Acidobacteriaceae bacterium]